MNLEKEMTPHPWGEFLKARLAVIKWMSETMKRSDYNISQELSMDEHQVYLIRAFHNEEEIVSKDLEKGDVDEAPVCTTGLIFSNNVFLTQSFLDQHNIEYQIEDLEKSPLGLVVKINNEGKN